MVKTCSICPRKCNADRDKREGFCKAPWEPMIKNGIMQKGVLIRHLTMPGLTEDSFAVLSWIKANIFNVRINLMDQYRPEYKASEFDEINRRLTHLEFYTVDEHFKQLGLRSDDD